MLKVCIVTLKKLASALATANLLALSNKSLTSSPNLTSSIKMAIYKGLGVPGEPPNVTPEANNGVVTIA